MPLRILNYESLEVQKLSGITAVQLPNTKCSVLINGRTNILVKQHKFIYIITYMLQHFQISYFSLWQQISSRKIVVLICGSFFHIYEATQIIRYFFSLIQQL
jgi:hypothetical protein